MQQSASHTNLVQKQSLSFQLRDDTVFYGMVGNPRHTACFYTQDAGGTFKGSQLNTFHMSRYLSMSVFLLYLSNVI